MSVVGRLAALDPLGARRLAASLSLDPAWPGVAAFLQAVATRQTETLRAARRSRRQAPAAGRAPALRAVPLIDPEALQLRLIGPPAALAPLRTPGGADEALSVLARRWADRSLRATLRLTPALLHAAGFVALEARLLRLSPATESADAAS